MRAVICGLVMFFVWVTPAWAGGPFMLIGAAEDLYKTPSYAAAKAEIDRTKLAGFETIRLTQAWAPGETALSAEDQITLGNAIEAAQFSGVRVVLSVYPFGSSVTPSSDQDRADFAAYMVDIARRYPLLHDFIIGNEPNLNRFWLPQFGPAGEDTAAAGYEALLATTYDALKLVRPHSTVYGGALAPRGVDKPATGRDTHSPTAFITDLGAAYRASGRQLPIMDAFAFHPYPENSATGPNFPHPAGTSVGLADYAKLVALLGAAFDGTAQRGSALPILYDEFGIETQIPPTKAALYTGSEPATTKPVDETTQAQMYRQAMQISFCQPTVMGLLLFHVQDEAALSAWQSGEFYVDGTPKTSLVPVRSAAQAVRRGIVARCDGLKLTPKLALHPGTPGTQSEKVFLTCSLDCTYTVTLDRAMTLTGNAVGGVTKTLLFAVRLPHGRHRLSATATAALNIGPPRITRVTFRS